MTDDEKLAAILAAVQTDPGNRGLAKVPGNNLFTATVQDFKPACRSIAHNPRPAVAIATGFYIPTAEPPASETDGPLGAYFLARALSTLSSGTLVVTDTWGKPALEAAVRQDGQSLATTVVSIPPGGHPWPVFFELDWKGNVGGRSLTHLISIERVGPSRRDGRCYSMRGRDITDHTPPMHHLFDGNGIDFPRLITIGIGDGGNEIGMGKLPWLLIDKNIANGSLIACRVPTDHLIVAGVSNWGAYALAAGVFVLKGVKPPPDLFNPDREREILEVMVREGPLVDGVTGKQTATVDGLSWDEYARPLVRIREILES